MKSVAFVMLVMPLLIGCQHHRDIPVDVAIEEMDQHSQASQLEESYYFRIPRRNMRYKKCTQ